MLAFEELSLFLGLFAELRLYIKLLVGLRFLVRLYAKLPMAVLAVMDGISTSSGSTGRHWGTDQPMSELGLLLKVRPKWNGE